MQKSERMHLQKLSRVQSSEQDEQINPSRKKLYIFPVIALFAKILKLATPKMSLHHRLPQPLLSQISMYFFIIFTHFFQN